MRRPTVGFFDLSCCEGCQLQVANLGEELLDILERIDLVEFREIMSEQGPEQIDIAIVEGSVVNHESEERLLTIRSRCDVLVAYGSCATIGGINGMKNLRPISESQRIVYGKKGNRFSSVPTRPLKSVVRVDYVVHGCPIYPPEFIRVVKSALAGLPYAVPDYAVCVECKFNENVCMYDRGVTCLGPVTRAGCNSWCINAGNVCYGCRGMVSNPNLSGAEDVLRRYGLSADLIAGKMLMYNAAMEGDDGA